MSPLHRAASKGDVDLLQQVIHERGIDEIDRSDDLGFTAMHHVAQSGHVGIIKALLRLGSKAIDHPGHNYDYPMVIAMEFQQYQVMEALVRLGSKALDYPIGDGTIFHLGVEIAIWLGTDELFEILIRLGSSTSILPTKKVRLQMARFSNRNARSIGKQGRRYSQQQGCTPLFAAARNGHVSVIEALVRLGSKAIDTPNNDGWTPLRSAMHEERYYTRPSCSLALVGLGANSDFPTDNIAKIHLQMLNARINEQEVAELRYRVYFARSLVQRLLVQMIE